VAAADLPRRLVAEALGTGLLVATVVGSGIMAAKLASGDQALALLCNTLPTGAILVVLITVLAPVSGAHLNPAVSAAMALRHELTTDELTFYMLAQIAGGIAGSWLAHAMFDLPLVQASITVRTGLGQWLGELVPPSDCCSPFSAASASTRPPCLVRGPLHHRRLLVHELDQFRKPGRHHRPRAHRHLRRHPARRCAGLRPRPAHRRPDCQLARRMAVCGTTPRT
jgi:hypothetical protein